MRYTFAKDLIIEQVQKLQSRGGKYQKAAKTVYSIIGAMQIHNNDPFHGLKMTNHGESRISKCIKYDLEGFCRLVTIMEKGIHAMIFVGDHEECESWLNTNRGYTLTIDDNFEIVDLKISNSNTKREVSNQPSETIYPNLLSNLNEYYLNVLQENINAKTYKLIESFNSFTSSDEILKICLTINDNKIQNMVFDVLASLKEGNIDEANHRIRLFKDELVRLEEFNEENANNIQSNERFIFLEDLQEADFQKLISTYSWYGWMLFLHPKQREVVNADFNGPARLLGVSGSGKTCVAVKRAIRLANEYPKEKILITTINVALADLIKNLIQVAVSIESRQEEILKQIEVKSFWQLSKELIEEFVQDPIELRSLDVYSDRNLEDVDQIWDEFYLCLNNNDDADVFEPIQTTLLSRNIFASEYIRQELDWIRSAVSPNNRREYLDIERTGRFIPLTKGYRSILLDGLGKWEDKMKSVGVCDYLGLLKSLYKFEDKIKPKYRCIIVDELQDFGTTELAIIRKLVPHKNNDLFLCGDIAQQVQTKNHRITAADIKIIPSNYMVIKKNYRNSREILEAASELFKSNTTPDQYNTGDFELLEPEYASFSSPKPFLRKAPDFKTELISAVTYLEEDLEEKEKGCVAICGVSYFNVEKLSRELDKIVLDGKTDINKAKVFISDLNQTKGFEFDKMIIINCSDRVFPDPSLPEEEHYKEISKLYVAMTRAKKELTISYSGSKSKVFFGLEHYFNCSTTWDHYVSDIDAEVSINIPENKIQYGTIKHDDITGRDYLKQKKALGLSNSAQHKIQTIVTGKIHHQSGSGAPKQTSWYDMRSFIDDLSRGRLTPQMSNLLGRKTHNELVEHFEIIKR